jgi:hypothetical protein
MKTTILALILCGALSAQWVKIPSKGRVDLTAPAPRVVDGHPDLSGVWEPNGNRFVRDIAVDLKPGDDEPGRFRFPEMAITLDPREKPR